MKREARRQLKSGLLKLPEPVRGPVVRGLLRGYEAYLATRAVRAPDTDAEGLPIPPAKLRVLVAGTQDADSFLADGRSQTDFIRGLVEKTGRSMESMDAILDFGCGCGRLTRHWSKLAGPNVHGTDYNEQPVAWCNENLPFMTAATNGLAPPLRYEDESFDLIYALSVFTHLTAELEQAWLQELQRVLKPGGLLFFTVHGDYYKDRLVDDERVRYDRGEPVTQFDDVAGTNLCARYHPATFVRNGMLPGFEILDFAGGDRAEADEIRLWQDAYLVRTTRGSQSG